MATIYITDETRQILGDLTTIEKRSISDEIDFLVAERIKELQQDNFTQQNYKCQAEGK